MSSDVTVGDCAGLATTLTNADYEALGRKIVDHRAATSAPAILITVLFGIVGAEAVVLAGCDLGGRPSAPGLTMTPSGQPGPPPVVGTQKRPEPLPAGR